MKFPDFSLTLKTNFFPSLFPDCWQPWYLGSKGASFVDQVLLFSGKTKNEAVYSYDCVIRHYNWKWNHVFHSDLIDLSAFRVWTRTVIDSDNLLTISFCHKLYFKISIHSSLLQTRLTEYYFKTSKGGS